MTWHPNCRCGHHSNVLAYTALLFLLPAYALPRSQLKAAVVFLILTSLLYHSNHTYWTWLLDSLTVRVVALLGVATVVNSLAPYTRMDALATVLLATVVAIHVAPMTHIDGGGPLRGGGPLHVPWHASMHAVGAAGLLAIAQKRG